MPFSDLSGRSSNSHPQTISLSRRTAFFLLLKCSTVSVLYVYMISM